MPTLSQRMQDLPDDREELLRIFPHRRLGEADGDPRGWETARIKRFIALMELAESKGLL